MEDCTGEQLITRNRAPCATLIITMHSHFSRHKKEYATSIVILSFLILWILLLYYVGPKTIVNYVGVENIYLIVFLLGVFGGVSSITSVVFYSTFATALAGGASPVFLVLVGAPGLIISDSIFFLAARYGKNLFGERENKWVERIRRRLDHYPDWSVPAFVFAYIGLTPLPNDIMMIALALMGYDYRKIALPLYVGDFMSLIFFVLFYSVF